MKPETALPQTRAPEDTSIDNNETYVAAVTVPHVQLAGAHLGEATTTVLVCVEEAVLAGALSVVTAVYDSIVSLTINAALIEDSLALLAFLWHGGFLGHNAHKLIVADSPILN